MSIYMKTKGFLARSSLVTGLLAVLSACGGTPSVAPPVPPHEQIDIHGNPNGIPLCPQSVAASLVPVTSQSIPLVEEDLRPGVLQRVSTTMAVSSDDGQSSVVVSEDPRSGVLTPTCMRNGGEMRIFSEVLAPSMLGITFSGSMEAVFRRHDLEYVGRGNYRVVFYGLDASAPRSRISVQDPEFVFFRTPDGLIEMMHEHSVPGGQVVFKSVFRFEPSVEIAVQAPRRRASRRHPYGVQWSSRERQ